MCSRPRATGHTSPFVSCVKTIEHTCRFLKQILGWHTLRARHPEQADRWTWLSLPPTPNGASPGRWSPTAACPGSARIRRAASPPTACAGRFRHCCSRSARPPACHNPAVARPDGRKGAAPVPRRAIRPSRRPPDAMFGRGTPPPRRIAQPARPSAWLNHKNMLLREADVRDALDFVSS